MLKRDDFNPRFIELFLNSNYLERKELYNNIKLLSSNFKGKILDLGCGIKPYEKLFKVEKIININANMSAICLLLNKYIYYKISSISSSILRKGLRIIETIFFTPVLNLLGLLFLKLQKKDNELYIDKIIYAKKVKDV